MSIPAAIPKPTLESGLPAAALDDEIRRLVAQRKPASVPTSIERRPAPYRSSWWLEELAVICEGGEVVELVLKDIVRPVPGSEADRVKPRQVTDSNRERWVYEAVLGPVGVQVPEFYGAVPDQDGKPRWILLERIEGFPLAECGGPAAWLAAARWLGAFHKAVRLRPPPGGPLVRHDVHLHRWWYGRAVQAATESQRGALLALEVPHRTAIREALQLEPTVIHGEFYPSNVVVAQDDQGCRVWPVDWEMTGMGPPLLDLAALTSGGWSSDDREQMALAYREEAQVEGEAQGSREEFFGALTACRLLLAMQWLAWEPSWDPPEEHRTDWLEEAKRCAEEMNR